MADQKPPATNEDIEKELTVGNFAAVQARTVGFQLAGVALGFAAGWGLAKTGLKNTIAKWIANSNSRYKAGTMHAEEMGEVLSTATDVAGKWVLPWGGAIIGSTLGGIASMYEHWIKVERERLSVQEINKDVASLMEKRVEFEDTIDKQHAIVKTMLARQESAPTSMADKILAEKEKANAAERTHP
jgi:hypothetical protein